MTNETKPSISELRQEVSGSGDAKHYHTKGKVRKRGSEMVSEFILGEDFISNERRKINELLVDFSSISHIEKYELEKEVLDGIMNGTSLTELCKQFELRFPGVKFTTSDIKHFLERNTQIVKRLKEEQVDLASRHITAIVQLEEELCGLYLYTKDVLKKFRENGDSSGVIGALNALNKTLANYAKLKGWGGFGNAATAQLNVQVNNGTPARNASSVEADFNMVDDEK